MRGFQLHVGKRVKRHRGSVRGTPAVLRVCARTPNAMEGMKVGGHSLAIQGVDHLLVEAGVE